ncbi:MAG: GNAT family N-acetyltransferase [Candidatus Rokubacteria bacterium]|nr:GNAT family N-acetyltransferase [Candidatus Rokubacteria bacterium]
MQLRPIDGPQLLQLVAGWLASKETSQWLEFGDGAQIITPMVLKVMTQRPTNFLRVFTADDDALPIGVVGLNNVNRHFRTATLWAALGDARYGAQRYTTRACSRILTMGFTELGLHAINTWVVDTHTPSFRIVERLRFRFVGRQRQCHWVDGQPYDRLWFDLLASEHTSGDAEG